MIEKEGNGKKDDGCLTSEHGRFVSLVDSL